jgi:N-methylhydantoinase A
MQALNLTRLPRASKISYFPDRLLVMKSDGGAASARMLTRTPIQTIMSGPVAGVIGGRHLGDVKGIANLITFDTGGTSSDMAVLPGRPLLKSEVTVARHPLRINTIDIETIGAGGGSIASVRHGGVLKVGPQSAGANPGPACYSRGGEEPTLTDALVVLGYLNPAVLLEGAMPIDRAKAHAAVVKRIAEPLRLSAVEAAWGILRVLVTNVITAMRTITVERGYDPREFTLVPFGGMGPTIAGIVAAELGINHVLVPSNPGTFSAQGMLVTDVYQEWSLTRITLVDGATPSELDAIFIEMEAKALKELAREQFPRERLQTLRRAGMRYRGQSYEVTVPVPSLNRPDDLADLVQRFHSAHQRRYGHMAEAEVVEIVNFQVTAVGQIPKAEMKIFDKASAEATPPQIRQVHFNAFDACDVEVVRRSQLSPGARIEGPTIIEEQTSTTVLYPGQHAKVDPYLNIEFELSGAKS